MNVESLSCRDQAMLMKLFLLFHFLVSSYALGDESWSITGGERSMLADYDNDNYTSVDQDQVAPSPVLVLAPRRSYRNDPLDGFRKYTGGWNISNRHYWASVGYTAVPFFSIALIWFAAFGICLSLVSLFHCCRKNKPSYGYSRIAYALSLILLVLFTILAMIGCAVLYIGQCKFHSITTDTLTYVVGQADATSNSLRNVSEYLSAAKQINMVGQVSLPPNVQTDIDQIQTNVDSAARTLSDQTDTNSKKIKHIIESAKLALIVLSVAMLILTFLGFALSMFGKEIPLYILVIVGWLLVTATFILCGVFLLLHNVAGDTCVAMNQWVQNPTAHTALDDVIPCVDKATAQDTLNRSKEVTSQLVDLINTVISNVSNINFASNFAGLYYNQSGPLLPSLCNPFFHDLTDRACGPGEVDLDNATAVWSGFVCQTSNGTGICVTTGRLNPSLYGQMDSAVKLSYGLYQYGPFLVELEECTFVQQVFADVRDEYCPGLRKYSRIVYDGLVMVAAAVMVSLVLWVVYGRERRHRAYARGDAPGGGGDNRNRETEK